MIKIQGVRETVWGLDMPLGLNLAYIKCIRLLEYYILYYLEISSAIKCYIMELTG